jgi:hypothetical protein
MPSLPCSWLCNIHALVTICSQSLVDGLKSKDPKRLGVEDLNLRMVDVRIGVMELGMGMSFIIFWCLFKTFFKTCPFVVFIC